MDSFSSLQWQKCKKIKKEKNQALGEISHESIIPPLLQIWSLQEIEGADSASAGGLD